MILFAAILSSLLLADGAPTASAQSCPRLGSVVEAALLLGVPQVELDALLPSLSLHEREGGFDVVAGNQTRSYNDLERDCSRRARWAAAFVALVVAPVAQTPSPPKPPQKPPALIPLPPPLLWQASAELTLFAQPISDRGYSVNAWGGWARAALMRGRWGGVVGVATPYEEDTALQGPLRMQHSHWPMEVGVRVRPGKHNETWSLLAETGLRLVYLRANAVTSNAQGPATSAWTWGPKVGLITRARVLPWLWLQAGVDAVWFPSPLSVVVAPQGRVGSTERFGLGGTLGVAAVWPP